MRAIFVDKDEKYYPHGERVLIDIKDNKEQFHHLTNVVRVKIDEHIMLLNGKGLVASARIVEISKKYLSMVVTQSEHHAQFASLDLVVGIIKREGLEDLVRMSVELGVHKLKLVWMDYSQRFYDMRVDRLQKIMIQALLQSNNPWLPEIEVFNKIDELDFSLYDNILCFHPVKQKNSPPLSQVKGKDKDMLLLGPEGGLSDREVVALETLNEKIFFVHLPTPILRAETALPTICGYYLGLTQNQKGNL